MAADELFLMLMLLPSACALLFEPAVTFANPGNAISVSIEIDPAFLDEAWSGSAVDNAQTFATALPQSRFSDLRDIADRLHFECGDIKLRNEPVDVRKMNSIRLLHNGTAHGPCEMWLNGTRVFNATNCVTDDRGRSKLFPVPYSACHGVCAFSTYWLLLDEPTWRLHRICVAVANANGEASREAPRRLMETVRPFTRDNLYAHTQGLGWVRDLLLGGGSRFRPSLLVDFARL